MRKIFVLALAVLFLIAIPVTAFAAYSGPTTNAPSTNTPANGEHFTTTQMQDGDSADNNIGNANATGKNIQLSGGDVWAGGTGDPNDIVKSKGMQMNTVSGETYNQRTHGSYQANTNSCATCHQTHTGSAKDLLLKQGVFESCTACHDGTLGFYNVYTESTAGTFGGTVAGNASVHMADGSVEVTVAPGYFDYSGSNNKPTEAFDCASCHAPHGSYSDRILHYSPNGMSNVDINEKGNKLVGYTVENISAIPAASAASADFKVVRGDAGVIGAVEGPNNTPVSGTIIAVLKKVNNSGTYSYVFDNNPWVAGIEHDVTLGGGTTILNYTRFNDTVAGVTYDITENRDKLRIMYGFGYAKDGITAGSINDVDTVDIARAYVVKLTGKDGYNPTAIFNFGGVPILKIDTDIYDEQNYGYAISKYCGACHTDYFIHSGQQTDGNTMEIVFRHSTDKDRFNCLKCHYAHGTDESVMRDALDRNEADLVANHGATSTNAKAYLTDKNPSSALKRYVNMAVCWKCHSGVGGKSSKLMNNMEYYDNFQYAPDGGYLGENVEDNWTNQSPKWEESDAEPSRNVNPEMTRTFRGTPGF